MQCFTNSTEYHCRQLWFCCWTKMAPMRWESFTAISASNFQMKCWLQSLNGTNSIRPCSCLPFSITPLNLNEKLTGGAWGLKITLQQLLVYISGVYIHQVQLFVFFTLHESSMKPQLPGKRQALMLSKVTQCAELCWSVTRRWGLLSHVIRWLALSHKVS